MAAPVASYAPPPYQPAAVQSASYVSPPVQYVGQQQQPSFVANPIFGQAMPPVVAPREPPQALTQGIPDPQTIEKQKAGYAKALEKQYQDGAAAIDAENNVKKQMLAEQAKQQIAQYSLQVQSQLQAQNLLLDQQMNSQMMMLQEAAMAQKSALEQQAAALTLEYQQKKAEEDMLTKQYQIQKQYFEAESKLAQQFQKVTQQEQAAMQALGTQHLQMTQPANLMMPGGIAI